MLDVLRGCIAPDRAGHVHAPHLLRRLHLQVALHHRNGRHLRSSHSHVHLLHEVLASLLLHQRYHHRRDQHDARLFLVLPRIHFVDRHSCTALPHPVRTARSGVSRPISSLRSLSRSAASFCCVPLCDVSCSGRRAFPLERSPTSCSYRSSSSHPGSIS